MNEIEKSNILARKILKTPALFKYTEYDYLITECNGKYKVTYRDGMVIVDDLDEKELNKFFRELEGWGRTKCRE